MDRTCIKKGFLFIVLTLLGVAFSALPAKAVILGETGTTFNLTAKEGSIRTSDGDSVPMWGYALPGKEMQYPAPTLIVNQGDTITINLTNQLKQLPVSILVPGMQVTATGGVPGLLTREAPPDNGATTVTYTFTATQPGTYTYYSGTRSDIEVEMGLVGVIVVRPSGFDPSTVAGRRAFSNVSSSFDREYLMALSEVDVDLNRKIARGELYAVDTTERHPVTWFENGRNMPDTLADAQVSYLPNQPYNCFPLMHPGEKVLIRFVGIGLDLHPLHTHGQNFLQIARDGRVLNSSMNNDGPPDLGVSDYTNTTVPGESVDAIYGPWTGAKLGWDVYGPPEGYSTFQGNPTLAAMPPHTCRYPDGTLAPSPPPYTVPASCDPNKESDPNCFDPVTHEYCPDHGKPFPVTLPAQSELTFGMMWGGTPFLGAPETITRINTNDGLFHTQLNPNAGISFIWHSHNERELTTNNVFIGGMATMSLILPYTDPQGNPIVIDQYKP